MNSNADFIQEQNWIEANKALQVVMQGMPFTKHKSKFDVRAKATSSLLDRKDQYEFLSANPIKEGHTRCPRSEGRGNADRWDNVQSYQNWVVEIDEYDLACMTLEDWCAAMDNALKPLESIISLQVYSGGKSVHAFISTSTPVDRETWVKTAIAISKLVPNVDKNVLLQPNRLVRMPHGVRNDGANQCLLEEIGTARPFSEIQNHLTNAGVWDADASIEHLVPKMPNPIASEEWKKKNPFQAAVRELCLDKWNWSGGRTSAFYRDGSNPSSLADLVTCVYDHGDEADDPAMSWSFLAESYIDSHPNDKVFDASFRAIPERLKQRLTEDIQKKKQLMLDRRLDKASMMCTPAPIPTSMFSWETVTNHDVLDAIKGYPLEKIVNELRKVMSPALPLEIAMQQALVLIGCVTSQDNNDPDKISRERLRLWFSMNGLTQGTNFYCLVAAPSTMGKDIGGYVKKTARSFKVDVCTGGSREGIIDGLKDCPNLLIQIGEFKNYLDTNSSYENNMLNLLTPIFSDYGVNDMFSRKSGSDRKLPFVAPSLLANIQPDTLRKKFNSENIGDGFFGRLLVTILEDTEYSEPSSDFPVCEATLRSTLSAYAQIAGEIRIHKSFFGDLRREVFYSPLRSTANRIVNEYAPRLGLALTGSKNIQPEDWEKTKVLVRWYLKHHAKVLDNIGISEAENIHDRLERVKKLIRDAIRKCAQKKIKPTKTFITQQHNSKSWACDGKMREKALSELLEFGEISSEGDAYYLNAGSI